MEKAINYTARDFEDIKGELVSFSQKYYPTMADSFNDSSVGSWFIDLVSAVGDDLNYYIDRCYQENNIDSANQRSSLLNLAKINGVKVPGPKASICEVKLSCTLPLDNINIQLPNWDYAPLVKRGSVLGSGSYRYELQEDVNFGEQFNSDGVSNRTFTPNKNSNGIITAYTVTKTTLAVAGTSKIYKKVMLDTEVQPFMEVILPEKNIMEIESIIFKETSNYDGNPQSYEFFIDDEEYLLPNESVKTYRYFEVDALSDQYRFGAQTRYAEGSDGNVYIADEYNPTIYDDYTETSKYSGNTRTSRYFRGQWKPITQKFITEYTENNYLKITFGGATTAQSPSSGMTNYGTYIASKMINNPMLGILPKAGWTMFVYYRSGGGANTNVAQGAVNAVINANTIYPSVNATNGSVKSSVSKSLTVTNLSPSVAGKDAPSNAELKYLTKYATNAQARCVTLKDYKSKIMQIPPKYGCPFRCNAMETNNKVVISCLGLNADGKLDSALPQTLADNLVEYLGHYKSMNDYVEINSGKIYNLGIEADLFIDKNYTTADVIASVIAEIKDYFDVNNHDMGEDIFVGDLEKELNKVDGVISLIDLRIYNIYNGSYSKDKSPLPKHIEYTDSCGTTETEFFNTPSGSLSFRIGLDEIDHVLYSDYNSMFEILNPSYDIQIRAKLR